MIWYANSTHCRRSASGSVIECLTRDGGVVGLSLTGDTVSCPWARPFILCLVLVQSRKTHTDVTEKLLTGMSQTNQLIPYWVPIILYVGKQWRPFEMLQDAMCYMPMHHLFNDLLLIMSRFTVKFKWIYKRWFLGKNSHHIFTSWGSPVAHW